MEEEALAITTLAEYAACRAWRKYTLIDMNGNPLAAGEEMKVNEGSAFKESEVRLQGVSICPGIGIGRVRIVDLDIPIPQDELDLPRVAAEQDRYSRAVEAARCHLPEHIATVHGDPIDRGGSHLRGPSGDPVG